MLQGEIRAPLMEDEEVILYDASWLRKALESQSSGGIVVDYDEMEEARVRSKLIDSGVNGEEVVSGEEAEEDREGIPFEEGRDEIKEGLLFNREKKDFDDLKRENGSLEKLEDGEDNPSWLERLSEKMDKEGKKELDKGGHLASSGLNKADGTVSLGLSATGSVKSGLRLGKILMVLALAGILYSFIPFLTAKGLDLYQSLRYGLRGGGKAAEEVEDDKGQVFMGVKKEDKEDFYIKIDKIGLESRVIPEVDASDKDSYGEALKKAVAHAKGTSFPSDNKLVYIFAHSTNYPWFIESVNALFYKIEELESGDEIKVVYNDVEYVYRVFDKKVIKADEVDFFEEYKDKDVLVLQSCYPPGTAWKRLVLFSEKIGSKKLSEERVTFGDLMRS